MGKTFLVKLKKTGFEYVMKRIDYLDEQDKKRADEEVEQMKKLDSRFTVKLICVFPDRMELCLILEYCRNGDLRKVIGELQKLPIEERINKVWNLFAQIAQALDFMHSNQIIHRDIKPENIFLMEDGTIRLGDFGLAKELTQKYYETFAGTKFYLAAEVWLQNRMTYMSDMFAFGVVLFELLTSQHPFKAPNEQATIDKIKNGQNSDLPDWVPQEMKNPIIEMLNSDQQKRPATKDLMKIEMINNLILKFDDDQFIRELNIDKFKQINEEIKNLNKSNIANKQNLQTIILNDMKAVRYIRTGKIPNTIDEMKKLSNEIIENCTNFIHQVIQNKDIIEIIFQSGFIIEFIELIKQKPANQIKKEWIEILLLTSKNGTAEQTHQMYEIEIFQILTSIHKNSNKEFQQTILQIFINVIKKGWKQVYLNQTTSSSSQFNIQQIISINHPYLEQLEQQGIIRQLIEDIIMNEKIDIFSKESAWQFLIFICPEGIILPPDIKLQVINHLCGQSKSQYFNQSKIHFVMLSILAINQDNHQMIIDGKVMDDAIELIRQCLNKNSSLINKYNCSFHLIINLFLFGSQQTQQLIQSKLSKETLNKLKDGYYQDENLAKQLLCAYSDQQGIKDLIQIKRIIGVRNEEELIDLINFGLIQLLNEINEKLIKEDENGEGKMIIIEETIKLLVQNNSEIGRIIIEETDFIEQQLLLLNQIPTDQVQEWHLSPLYTLIINLSYQFKNELMNKLFEDGIIQFMMKILGSKNNSVRRKAIIIILYITQTQIKELKEGEQHPYYQQLQSDGTISQLIQIFKVEVQIDKSYQDEIEKFTLLFQINEDNGLILPHIALVFAHLYKALPLPPEIQKKIIEELTSLDAIFELALLAECPDNHDAILANYFEQTFFHDIKQTLEYLQLTLLFLKFGSDLNQKKIINSVKKNIEQLIDDEYVDTFRNIIWLNWNEEKIQQIKSKAKEINSNIIIVEQKQKRKRCVIQ